MHKELISVIVPIYNIEEYIEDCILSICNQTYKNLEIILINDGSNDESLEICKHISKKDNRIVLVDKNNEGLAEARNVGIRKAKGNYIAFVDGDDYIHPEMYEKLYKALVNNDADISECEFMKVFDNRESSIEINYKKDVIMNSKESMKSCILNDTFSTVSWNKLYKKELFLKNNIYFPIGKLHEDQFTTYKLFSKVNKAIKIGGSYYYYRQRPNSIMNTFNIKRLDGYDAIKECIEYIKLYNPQIVDEILDIYYQLAIEYLIKIYEYRSNIPGYKDYIIRIRQDIKSLDSESKQIKIRYKIFLLNISIQFLYLDKLSKKYIVKLIKH